MTLSIAAVALTLLVAPEAGGQEAGPPPVAAGSAGEASALVLTLPWTARSGVGTSLAYENGAFGQTFEQAIRFEIPFLEHFAAAIRGLALYGPNGSGVALGGRLDLIGRTSVLLNLLRIYGGGGVGVLTNVSGADKGQTGIEGGGHFGVEFFLNAQASFYFEIGGNGCGALASACSGATAIAGVSFYPF